MADAKTAFDTSDSVKLKGNVSGVTRLSKNAKALMGLGAFLLMCFILFSIFSMGGDEPAPTSPSEPGEEQAKGGGKVGNRPASPGDFVRGVGDGQAAATLPPTGSFDPKGTTSLGPAFDVAKATGGSAVVIVPGTTAVSSAPGAVASGASSPAGARHGSRPEGVVVPSTAGVDLNEASNAQRAPTPQERRLQLVADERDQLLKQAKRAGAEVTWSGGGGGGGAEGLAGVAGLAGLGDLKTQMQAALGNAQGAGASVGGGGLPRVLGAQDDANKQQRKEQFMKDAQATPGNAYMKQLVTVPITKYELKRGWLIPAALQDSVNSDLPGEVCARVREDVYDTALGRYLLIPQGTVACGVYDSQVAVGQTRLLMAWQRLTFPDGSALSLDGLPGADQAGAAGFDGDVDNHYFKIFGGALMMSAISAGVQLSQPATATGSNSVPTTGQTLAAAAGQQLGQVSSSLVQRNMQIQPTITQAPGYRFNIRITRDIAFPAPYLDRRLSRR